MSNYDPNRRWKNNWDYDDEEGSSGWRNRSRSRWNDQDYDSDRESSRNRDWGTAGPSYGSRGYSNDDREERGWNSGSNYGSGSHTEWGRGRSQGEDYNYGSSGYGRRNNQDWGTSSGGMSSGSSSYGQSGSQSTGRYAGRGPQGYQRSDDRIREDVNERLTWHGELDATHINVSVENGEVTLEGKVEDRQQKRTAEDCAYEVSGVKDVHNRLGIDRNIFQQIGDALTGNREHSTSGSTTSGNQPGDKNGQRSRSTTTSGRS